MTPQAECRAALMTLSPEERQEILRWLLDRTPTDYAACIRERVLSDGIAQVANEERRKPMTMYKLLHRAGHRLKKNDAA